MGCGSSVTVDETPERGRVELLESPRKHLIQGAIHSTPSPRAIAAADKATRHWLVRSLPRFQYIPKVKQSQEDPPTAKSMTIQDDSFSSAEGFSDRRRESDRSLIVESLQSSWNRDRTGENSPTARYSPTSRPVPSDGVSETPVGGDARSTVEYITGLSAFEDQPTQCESPLVNRGGFRQEEDEGGVACSDCMVCLNPLPEHRLVTLPCFHTFHEECVLDWLNEKGLCPTCRTPLTPAALTWSYEFQEELLQQYD